MITFLNDGIKNETIFQHVISGLTTSYLLSSTIYSLRSLDSSQLIISELSFGSTFQDPNNSMLVERCYCSEIISCKIEDMKLTLALDLQQILIFSFTSLHIVPFNLGTKDHKR